ncbi:hypothetical protein R3P38DRAFT_2565955 [Favolaschia claudopus]|uniref:Uncharacterized protein n=1 Tax=Favolaschia claudopus TaxID=2862362 RepID=A0AAV9ZYI7_9AGAR
MVDCHSEPLKNGLTPEQVKFSTSVPVLRDASVKPIVELYEWGQTLPGWDLIRRAKLTRCVQSWEKCTVGEFNLGEECLKSKKTKAAYHEYLLKHPDFRKEIEDKIGQVLDVDEEEDDVFTRDDQDSTEIPLHSVVHAALQIDVPPEKLPNTSKFCVSLETVGTDGSGTLKANGEMENIWAYNDNGQPWSEGNLADETF